MQKQAIIRVTSFRKEGRVVPKRACGLRAGSVVLRPGGMMDWHSNGAREELLIALTGRVHLEAQTALRRVRRVALSAGQCALLPNETRHRVVNRSTVEARYLYVTAPIQ